MSDQMSEPATGSRPPRPTSSTRRTWLLIGLVLSPAVVLPLLVPLFDSVEPTLLGFPFYFWFQMALIPVAVVLTVIAYYLAKGADRRERAAREQEARR
ncbi:DUF3311 domain-containing protein [Nocardioides sp. GCM10027113]|uniref:DUF3311 domain-containing protein n=1 Tax=unclassified Nocardioides TaxID=2615069 RepID=UPI0036138673